MLFIFIVSGFLIKGAILSKEFDDFQRDKFIEIMYSDFEGDLKDNFYSEQREQVIEDFILERMQSFYRLNPELAVNAISFLKKSKKYVKEDPTSSLIYSAIAIEVLIKFVFLKPIIYGMVHNELSAEIISNSLLKQSGIDRFKELVFGVIDENVELGCLIKDYKRSGSNITLWKERDLIQNKRNKIMHTAIECSYEEAKNSIDICIEFISIIVAVIRNFDLDISNDGIIKDYVLPEQNTLF